MKEKTEGGGVTRARIGTLRLRVPAAGPREAKAIAFEVASRLALRAGELGPAAAERETVRVKVSASPAMSRERLAETIAGRVCDREAGKRGRG